MIRDNFKNKEYFERYLKDFKGHILRGFDMITSGKVVSDRLFIFKKGQLDFILNYCIANYSSSNSISEVKVEFEKVLNYLSEGWPKNIVNVNNEGLILNQYGLDAYDQMLWMLSLGYLLNIPNVDFKKLVEVIDRDGVKDYLFEFIIRAKLPERPAIQEESYQEYFGVPKTFEKLRLAITETDKTKAEKLVKEFITKDWYKNHKDAGWYNSHKSKHDAYFGYWSFETAAVVKIMQLDDSSFIDCQYYPKDLVHQENI